MGRALSLRLRRHRARRGSDDKWEVGSLGWTRTNDQRINSPTLYRLSYQGTESLLRARILEARPSYVKQSLRISDLAPKSVTPGGPGGSELPLHYD